MLAFIKFTLFVWGLQAFTVLFMLAFDSDHDFVFKTKSSFLRSLFIPYYFVVASLLWLIKTITKTEEEW